MSIPFRNPAFLLALATLLYSSVSSQALDWPQWRGPDRNDVSKETGLLKEWPKEGPKRLWISEKAGLGYASFAVVGGKLYTMGAQEDGTEQLIALDAVKGTPVWATPLGGLYRHKKGDGPRGTPTVNENRVYGMGGHGVVICANAADGKVVWTKAMKDFGGRAPGWGYSESLLVDGDKVLCTPGGSEGAILALNKVTGEKIWQTKEFTAPAHYSSIIAVDYAGQHQYIQLTVNAVVGVSAKDGKLLWRSEWPGRTAVVPTPIFNDGLVYISSGYGVGCKLVKLGPGNEASDVYENKVMINHHGGVINLGDHLYGYSDGPGWVCQDLKSGNSVWNSKNLGKGAVAYADGMLYCLEERSGTIVLIKASKDGWSEHGRFKIDPQSSRRQEGMVWTHPVISNGRLYLRDQEFISCYDIKKS
jgi:outer membrane protein assembly factor BamB